MAVDHVNNREIENRVGTLEVGLQLVSRDVQVLSANIKTVDNSVADFRRDWEARTLDEQKTRQELVVAKSMGIRDYVVMGAALIGAASACLAGGQYMIHSTTDTLAASMASQVLQMTDRQNSTATSLTSIRENMNVMNIASGDIRVQVGKLADRQEQIMKKWESFDSKDWAGVNATQSADILAIRARMDWQSKEIERLRDAAMTHAVTPK